MKQTKLYTDFTPTLDNCDKEPIHRPGAVQGHGYLLAIQHSASRLAVASRNVESLLGIKLEEVWQSELQEWLPEPLLNTLRDVGRGQEWQALNPVLLELNGSSYNLIGHRQDDTTILELEPVPEGAVAPPFRTIQQVTAPLSRCETEEELAARMAGCLKKYTGYDRVMVYRFSEDWHGEVLGEAKEDELESFLGLHYPATDIPATARRLFLLNGTRIIQNIYLPNSPLELNPHLPEQGPLDLSYAQLRATSPIHLEYLHNMGVQATFTVAIVVNDKLWGLFAHHHYGGERFLDYAQRRTCEVLSLLFVQQLSQIREQDYQQRSRQYRRWEEELFENFETRDIFALKEKLFDNQPSLLDLSSATGLALVLGEEIYLKGQTPTKEEVADIRQWLQSRRKTGIYSTRSMINDMRLPQSFAPRLAGLLSACVSEQPNTFVMWFKPPVSHTVDWGGNPAEAIVIEKREDARGVRLSPRKSFAKWKEFVKHESDPWQDYEIDMAGRVRERLIHSELKRAGRTIESLNRRLSMIMDRELEQIIYIASHDLQEPLRTISNFVGLMEEDGEDVLTEDLKFYLDRIVLSTKRMQALIKDLLDYSRIGRSDELENIDINSLIREVLEEMEPRLRETGGKVLVAPMPSLHGNRTELKQLFQNLISNALKYHRPQVSPLVEIFAEPSENFWRFAVRDNGIGIEEKDLDKIFQLFQRLHNKDTYEGTGIGLAQCKKIVEAYQGDIEAESTPGTGTTFHFTLTDK